MALIASVGLAGSAWAATTAPTVASVAAALKGHPVYVDPAADALRVDAAKVKAALPGDTYVAVLSSTAVPADAQPDELPALLSSQVGRGGTFIVLVDGRFYGASSTEPGRLGSEIQTAQNVLPAAGGDATATLVSLLRSLSGSGNLQDATGPSRAGGPVGGGILIAGLVIFALAGLSLWWWLRRKPRARSRPAPPLLDLVEIDHEGEIIRRVAAKDRVRESPPG